MYIHTDGLGSPVARTDKNGNLISRTRYEPYGATAAGATPTIGFTGHVNDPDTGLIYMQQRYYDPYAGRFLSTDPVLTDADTGSSFNRYIYANNSPYNYIDPDGRESKRSPAYKIKQALFQMALRHGQELRRKDQEEKARAARDALAEKLKPLGGKSPATVTGGVNTKTGETTAQACGGGKCAEDHVVDALGGDAEDIIFSEATRPRTGQEVPVCDRCEDKYGRAPFPKGTKFKKDAPPKPKPKPKDEPEPKPKKEG